MPEHNSHRTQGNLSHVSPWSVPIRNNHFFIVPSVQRKSTSDHFHYNRYRLYLASCEKNSHVAEEGVLFNHYPHWVIESQIWLLISQRSSLIKTILYFSIGSFSFIKSSLEIRGKKMYFIYYLLHLFVFYPLTLFWTYMIDFNLSVFQIIFYMYQNNILLLVSKLYASQNISEWLMGVCFFPLL